MKQLYSRGIAYVSVSKAKATANKPGTLLDSKIHDLMQELIDKFFAQHLSLSFEDAVMLHHKYYKEYGLAIEGLTRHHKIDPLEFNSGVDDALPLDSILSFNPALRQFLEDFDTSKVKLWLFTNAYISHGKRVVKLLGVEDLFEGITYCDYGSQPLICKPNIKMFEKAEREANVPGIDKCYFVDDSHLNCYHAQNRGWNTVHFVEPHLTTPQTPASNFMIHNLEELRELFPQFFKSKVY
ncbi:suppressor of deletion of TFIIS [Ophidiomyces ophidiicola]|uniref:Suppressor of deletion of TFIIS n=1 Tax=Ophidiomyces ophidiicola TaxID=1387563 RepID=A0ACB8V3G7_9EURO|nr:suppressor of deletion of TFIIS [Ophidiomyces ophidiicola]KAI1914977.1 suppressor of deletion of TFIIS [Ophidiomyces ophidiicola]KAI1923341.1 suppressor of deletion of TFIIS [Ophidiomyces ophidiicola]KAI1930083.1 suppressor of deletion of TFIIS [Ophidiomyces ophidiicola]KAI1943213.1 suppressor of deletion of TFIIS [Ophidiomyces ophidiicola]KAI1954976.1 suppressor of deletion of TFIIS [Ophidiomyces ophidiicola]